MVKEKYLWIAFFIAIIAVASYWRFLYQPAISLVISSHNQSGAIYPYQLVSVPLTVSNTGGTAIQKMGFGLYLNGNLTKSYEITLPAGKNVSVFYNFTPQNSGTYSIKLVADPSDLYNIVNRQSAEATAVVNIQPSAQPQPYLNFNSSGILAEDSFNESVLGYLLAEYLYTNFTTPQFELTGSGEVNNLVYPAIDVYAAYIKDIAVAHADYKNYTLTSLWLKGELGPSAIGEAAIGKGYNATQQGSMWFVNFGNDTSLCSWYSDGWLKNLIAFNRTCTSFLSNTNAFSGVNTISYLKYYNSNSLLLNYSGYTAGNYDYAGDITFQNDTYVIESAIRGPTDTSFSNYCYGTVFTFSNYTYCQTNLLGSGNYILVKNEKLQGNYNFSYWSLTNATYLAPISSQGLEEIQQYNAPGPKIGFLSAYVNQCEILPQLPCYNATFNTTALNFRLYNEYNTTVKLQGIQCFQNGTAKETSLSQSIKPGNYVTVSTPCYASGNVISGVPLGLGLYLRLYFNTANFNTTASGYAYILK